MKKLLLLDADIIIDLHTLGLFDRIIKGYDIHVTKTIRATGYHKKNLYPGHWEKTFTEYIREGKALRILFKKLT